MIRTLHIERNKCTVQLYRRVITQGDASPCHMETICSGVLSTYRNEIHYSAGECARLVPPVIPRVRHVLSEGKTGKKTGIGFFLKSNENHCFCTEAYARAYTHTHMHTRVSSSIPLIKPGERSVDSLFTGGTLLYT